jgi:hypothetical protein
MPWGVTRAAARPPCHPHVGQFSARTAGCRRTGSLAHVASELGAAGTLQKFRSPDFVDTVVGILAGN